MTHKIKEFWAMMAKNSEWQDGYLVLGLRMLLKNEIELKEKCVK